MLECLFLQKISMGLKISHELLTTINLDFLFKKFTYEKIKPCEFTKYSCYFKGYEKSKKDIREQARSFPFCTSGSPAVDDCYRRCIGKAKNPGIVDCASTQELGCLIDFQVIIVKFYFFFNKILPVYEIIQN